MAEENWLNKIEIIKSDIYNAEHKLGLDWDIKFEESTPEMRLIREEIGYKTAIATIIHDLEQRSHTIYLNHSTIEGFKYEGIDSLSLMDLCYAKLAETDWVFSRHFPMAVNTDNKQTEEFAATVMVSLLGFYQQTSGFWALDLMQKHYPDVAIRWVDSVHTANLRAFKETVKLSEASRSLISGNVLLELINRTALSAIEARRLPNSTQKKSLTTRTRMLEVDLSRYCIEHRYHIDILGLYDKLYKIYLHLPQMPKNTFSAVNLMAGNILKHAIAFEECLLADNAIVDPYPTPVLFEDQAKYMWVLQSRSKSVDRIVDFFNYPRNTN